MSPTTTPVTPALPRQGPRPLALHLMSATGAWLSSRAALPLLSSGLLPWRREFAAEGAAISLALRARERKSRGLRDDFLAAVDAELIRQGERFVAGLEAYRHHPYRRDLPEPPTVWQRGTTRLLDYGPPDGAPLLIVPSLINRAYILDLAPGQSLLRFLASQGLRPFLVDWGAPGVEERRFDLSRYIVERLEPAAAAAYAEAGSAPVIMGYCMGGLLALALAQRQPDACRGLALLATPWRFHAERAEHARLVGVLGELMVQSYALLGEVPVDVLQALFFSQDPLLALRKFLRFAELDPQSIVARNFVALEDWLNDGVPLALPVARECLGGWYGADLPGRGLWRVGGVPVQPTEITAPSLVVVPAHDRIVPPASAAALAEALPHAECWKPTLGHIGMVVARDAPKAVWAPLAAWLKKAALDAP